MLDQRRKAYLEAMGIDLWSSRQFSPVAEPEQPAAEAPVVTELEVVATPKPEPKPSKPLDPPVSPANVVKPVERLAKPAQPQPAVMHDSYPDFDIEEDLEAQYSDEYLYLSGAAEQAAPVDDIASLDWDGLAGRVSACDKCILSKTRTNTVFGVGNQTADLMIIGEAPGADEDRQGEPFVGRAGQLLTAMLGAIGFSREQVYIANILKCRPPGNRNPHVDEVAACQSYLNRQIALIEPKIILSVGGVSAHNLLHTDESVGRLRRQTHKYGVNNTPLMVTYHPAYLLRRPEEKAKVWEDLQKLHAALVNLNHERGS